MLLDERITIERLGPAHGSCIVRLSEDATEFDPGEVGDRWSPQELADWLGSSTDICLGAFRDGELIGFCLSHYHATARKVHLESLLVMEQYRGSGIGTGLFNRVVELYEALENRPSRFVFLTSADSALRRTFFDRLGFHKGGLMTWYQKLENLQQSPPSTE